MVWTIDRHSSRWLNVEPQRNAPALAAMGFADIPGVFRCLERLDRLPGIGPMLERCRDALLPAAAGTAAPDRALLGMERLLASAEDGGGTCRTLLDHPRLAQVVSTVLAGSEFLGDILLRHPECLEELSDPLRLARPETPDRLRARALEAVETGGTEAERLLRLVRMQRRELLRIGSCDLLGLLDLVTVTDQLSHLADAVVEAALQMVMASTGGDRGLCIIAYGKLGGGELNYSSDIDLVFVAAREPETNLQVGERLIDVLTRATPDGFLYRVDMRLRPWGQAGALVVTPDTYMAYLREHAHLWERQALIKARAIAGDRSLGEDLLQRAVPAIFESSAESVRVDVRTMKERIETQLRRRGQEWGEVKLGKGSIRDVEFVTQYLQIIHGAENPQVRSRNTLDGLARLHESGLLPAGDYRILADGYTFLRPIEHHLQIMHYRQTHALPRDEREMDYLALRLGFGGPDVGEQLRLRYRQHAAAIRAVYERYLEGRAEKMTTRSPDEPAAPDVGRHVARMAPSYAVAFTQAEIARHAELALRLDVDHLVEVEAAARGDGEWRVTIVAYDYAGELSLICGLLFVYGFSIQNGDVFTYELAHDPQRSTASTESTSAAPISRRRRRMTDRVASADGRRKIVDVFTVRPVEGEVHETVWARYAADLEELLRHLEVGRQSEAHGELARRVGLALQGTSADMETLPPIDVTIDNDATEKYTVLHIDAADTTGFLYEFTNALALTGVYVARVAVDSAGDRVQDTFYLTDTSGHKIEAPARLRELRAATVLVKHYTHLLPHSPNPESALLHFREFLGHLFSRPDWPDDMASLERPEVLAALARLLGVSDFLWDDFLRMQHHNLFPVVRDVHGLATARTKEQLRAMAAEALASAESVDGRRGALNAFKDREMFRVDMRHIQGHATSFGQFAAELTDVAEVVVETAYGLCYDDLVVRYGEPLLENGRACGGVVCALGKCGGRELGYASDIELMFVYAGKGFTAGPEVVATAEFYERLVVAFLDTIVARREGIFEIDLRLRPYGSAGSMAVSMQAFRRYFGSGGPAWPYERQALVRLRPIAGDAALGGRLLALRDEIVYEGRAFDVAAMRAMRERQLRHLVEPGRINAKFGPGGLVDAEYLVQGLQILHGAANPALRRVNTHEALDALSEAGVLSAAEHDRLGQAYAFLRDLINALRMVRGNARDLTVPEPGGKEFAFLARRLNYADDSAALQDDLLRHTAAIQELGAKLPGSA